MAKWDDLLDEKVDQKHLNNVFDKVKPILSEYKSEARSRRWFFWGSLGTALGSIVALVVYFRLGQDNDYKTVDMAMVSIEPELLDGVEVLEEFDDLVEMAELEDVLELEDWEGV